MSKQMLLRIKIPLRYCCGTYNRVKLAAFAVCRCQTTNVMNSLAQNLGLNNPDIRDKWILSNY